MGEITVRAKDISHLLEDSTGTTAPPAGRRSMNLPAPTATGRSGRSCRCRACPRTGTYVDGRIPAAGDVCIEVWSHIGRRETRRAVVLSCPESALPQGAGPYLRQVAIRTGPAPHLAAKLRKAFRG